MCFSNRYSEGMKLTEEMLALFFRISGKSRVCQLHKRIVSFATALRCWFNKPVTINNSA